MKPAPTTTSFIAARPAPGGFSLVEVMVASVLASFILAGTLSSFLMIVRSSQRIYDYARMEDNSRRTLEGFAQDVRMTSNLTYNNAASVTLTVPDNYTANGNQVTYGFGNVTVNSASYNNCFYRLPGNATSTAAPTVLLQNVTSCAFNRYDVLGNTTTTDSTTKRLELHLTESTTNNSNVVAAGDTLVSATYLLRNKP